MQNYSVQLDRQAHKAERQELGADRKLSDFIGKSVLRVEDERLLTGRGAFADDLHVEGELFAYFVRSPHAHARIVSIDFTRAAQMPGVRMVAHGETLAKAGLQPIDPLTRSPDFPVSNKDGSELPDVRRWPLARHKVRVAGEPVAVVVAESSLAARDAVESVLVAYEPLEAVTDVNQAQLPESPRVWDQLESNVCVDSEYGDRQAVDEAFSKAAKVVSATVEYPRHVVAFMEPRAVIAKYDKSADRYEVTCGSQSVHWHQKGIAEILNEPVEKVRVTSPDTGGGFGARTSPYPEFAVLAWLARATGFVVRCAFDRSESFLTDSQSRDHRLTAELAVDETGRMTAIRLSSVWRLGAYLNPRSIWLHASYMHLVNCGVYRIPVSHFQIKGFFTNTANIGAFRGVARAEASFALERVVDKAAQEIGMDRVSFRKLNMIQADEMPWTAPSGARYSAGDYPANFQLLLQHIDWDDFEKRRRAAAEIGACLGLGFSVYLDSVGGAPNEFAEVSVEGDMVEARVGTKSVGVGHETVFAQLLASRLQLPLDRVRIVDGDTDRVRTGSGTHASRSLRIGGSAIHFSAEKVFKKARELASHHLEVAESDLEYADGTFFISGTDRRIGLFEIAETEFEKTGKKLSAAHEHFTQAAMFASGCQACELEIDAETGSMRIHRFVTVSDPGRIFNPVIAEGQIHGGVAQGIGHAVLEKAHYDPSTGQLLSGSFMDYALPRADDMPMFECHWNPVDTDENPLGVKGVGELGITGAPAAVMNAICDALRPLGIEQIQMPATSESLWRAIQNAR